MEEAERYVALAAAGAPPASLAFLYGMLADGHSRASGHEAARQALSRAIAEYEGLSVPAIILAPLLVKLARVEAACGDQTAAEATCRKALTCAGERRQADRTRGEPYRGTGPRDPLADVREEAEKVLRSLGSSAVEA
jgi:hypothetical protein